LVDGDDGFQPAQRCGEPDTTEFFISGVAADGQHGFERALLQVTEIVRIG
jgi:hypothetical protein